MNLLQSAQVSKLTKQAAISADQMPVVHQQLGDINQALNNARLLDMVKKVGVGAVGAGVGARGLIGLYSMLSRNIGRTPVRPSGPRVIEVPYVEDEKRADDGWMKTIADYATGRHANSLLDHPAAIPAGIITAITGAGLGWKGTDMLLDRQRKLQRQQELEAAKAEFDQALLGQYEKQPTTKAAQVGQDLDKLYETMEKTAVLGAGVGAGLGIASIIALITGSGVYDIMKKRRHADIMRKAQGRRVRQLQQSSPAVLFARPIPVSENKPAPMQNSIRPIPGYDDSDEL